MRCLVCGKETEISVKKKHGKEIVIHKLTHGKCWKFFTD